MDKNGFTFIELLTVLSVISVFILLSVPLHADTIHKIQEETFINQLKNDVLFIQNQSVFHGTSRYLIRFYDGHYSILHGREPVFENREYPTGWTFLSSNRTLQFAETGTVINPRVIYMASDNEWIHFVFPLGKGGFYVEKEKRVLVR